ncbi:MAG: type II toxin-antitoxin system VapC family toxin [Firmicutes bacterium]|nr:type II toxin-antitoxin system VapC family toxin [Bacillota bacterium]
MRPLFPVIYWDASAVLSFLTMDEYHETAKEFYEQGGVHLLSSLSYTEVFAVLARLKRQGLLNDGQFDRTCRFLNAHPWRFATINPEREEIRRLAVRWPLRGADLWHLSFALALKREFPELILLTFDQKLRTAAEGEDLIGVH